MKRFAICTVVVVFSCFFSSKAFSVSLDELYRDIIRSDNRGYLPLFVKNRTAPLILLEEEDLSGIEGYKDSKSDNLKSDIVNLSKKLPNRSAFAKARQIQWLKTIAAIKANQVTPLELNDVTSRVKENDPKAIEILAWMYTNGVGVSTDFIEAFNLYKKAAQLNVANAERNALIVYKSMNEDQRRQIKNKASFLQPL